MQRRLEGKALEERLKALEGLPPPIWQMYGEEATKVSTCQPKWKLPEKVVVETAITGAFFGRGENPKQCYTPEEIRNSAIECIEAGSTAIHIHVRDDKGTPVTDVGKFHEIIDPIREKYGRKIFIDGCCVFGKTAKETLGPVIDGLLEMTPINTTAVYCGDTVLAVPPQYMQEKTKFVQDMGVKPMIALYGDGDFDNARRYLIDTGILEKPYYWNILPNLPGGSPMPNPQAMCESLLFFLRRINEIDPNPVVLVCASGRASSFLSTLSVLLGLHIRVGMEDTIYRWPHKDDLIEKNVDATRSAINIVHDLGLEVASADDLRKMIGLLPKE